MGAEFPAESAFEKIPVPSRLPKIFIFPRPYSLFPTRHRNFFQIRARQGKLTDYYETPQVCAWKEYISECGQS